MTTYPKQRHTFKHDGFSNPMGPLTAWVYNGILDEREVYANYIIEEIKGGKFMLVIENDSFIADNLADLEPRLFAWMENEGVTPIDQTVRATD